VTELQTVPYLDGYRVEISRSRAGRVLGPLLSHERGNDHRDDMAVADDPEQSN
jgi:hypothetical protein